MKKIYRALVRRSFLIVSGVLLAILSALISHALVKENNAEISAFQQEILTLEQRIDFRWHKVKSLERRTDFATILSVLLTNKITDETTRNIISRYVQDLLNDANSESTIAIDNNGNWLNQLLHEVDYTKKQALEVINDELYRDKQELEAKMHELMEQNDVLTGLALFFQIMGMILVLSAEAWHRSK